MVGLLQAEGSVLAGQLRRALGRVMLRAPRQIERAATEPVAPAFIPQLPPVSARAVDLASRPPGVRDRAGAGVQQYARPALEGRAQCDLTVREHPRAARDAGLDQRSFE